MRQGIRSSNGDVVEAIRLAHPRTIAREAMSPFPKEFCEKVQSIARSCMPLANSSTTARIETLLSALRAFQCNREEHMVPARASDDALPNEISDLYFGIKRTDTEDPKLARELLVDALMGSVELMSEDLLSNGSDLSELETNAVLTIFLTIAEVVSEPEE